MEISGSDSLAPEILKSQKGFALTLALSLIPVLLAAGFAFLFSGYLIKNWMQSLHLCRTELLKAQSQTKVSLNQLMALNKLASTLRTQLAIARALFQAAVAAKNPPLAAHYAARIAAIQSQRRTLDQVQKKLIWSANFQMSSGLQRVVSHLHSQNSLNQSRAPDFFQFRIHSIRASPQTLAVHPDLPDVAPIYELKMDFTRSQGLSVSWNSSFYSNFSRGVRWIQNQHTKKDHCAVSLKEIHGRFQEVLIEDKL